MTPLSARALRGLWMAMLLACVGCAASPEGQDPATAALPDVAPSVPGPYAVGRVDRFVTPLREGLDRQAFEVTVWYPADITPPAGRTPFSGLFGASVEGAPVLRGTAPFPLILFAHGLRAVRQQNSYQVEWLASRGYVVVSGDFHGSLLFEDLDELDILRSAVNRPAELLDQIDAAAAWAADPRDAFFRRIATDRIVAAGHSFGGFTVLAVTGVHGEIDALLDACFADPEVFDSINCSVLLDICAIDDAAAEVDRAACRERIVAATGGRTSWSWSDARIAGVIPMTPGLTPIARDEAWAAVTMPVMLMAGARDELIPPDPFIRPVYEHLGGPAWLLTFETANHLDFSQICLGALPYLCGNDPLVPARNILDAINTATAAFADAVIRGRRGPFDDLTAILPLEDATLRVEQRTP